MKNKEITIPREWLELLKLRMESLKEILPQPHSESTEVISRAWHLIGFIESIDNIIK